ncbi:hypothetical protein [Flindersiella endophytica]
MSAATEWRGLVNAALYGIDLSGPVADAEVSRRAGELIQQQMFTEPVDDYYQAASAALAAGEQIGFEAGEQAAARDFLTRLVAELDARRPWPVPPFQAIGSAEWPALKEQPVVARLTLSRMQVEERLSRLFDKQPPDGTSWPILLLRLRTGETVALQAPGGYTEPGVAIRAGTTAPKELLASFAQLTGIRGEEINPA